MARDIDTQFVHHGDGFGSHDARFCARAFDFKTGVVAEQSFGHLAAGGVSGAEDENSFFIVHM